MPSSTAAFGRIGRGQQLGREGRASGSLQHEVGEGAADIDGQAGLLNRSSILMLPACDDARPGLGIAACRKAM